MQHNPRIIPCWSFF